MRSSHSRLIPRVFLWLMGLGWVLIALASLEYFDPEAAAPFVIERLPVRFERLWLNALELHVASALVTFPLCLLLTTRFLQRYPSWHRWLGRITGVAVVALLVPSGVVLSFEAKGGALVTLGFLVSGAIVLVATVWGVLQARRREMLAHERAMRHVVAQMSVAVTSRALLLAFDFIGLDPDIAYAVALWVPVVASAAWIERRSGRLLSSFALSTPLPRSPS